MQSSVPVVTEVSSSTEVHVSAIATAAPASMTPYPYL